jgi:hypothetical protein
VLSPTDDCLVASPENQFTKECFAHEMPGFPGHGHNPDAVKTAKARPLFPPGMQWRGKICVTAQRKEAAGVPTASSGSCPIYRLAT